MRRRGLSHLRREEYGGEDGGEEGIVSSGAGDEGRAERREVENERQPPGKGHSASLGRLEGKARKEGRMMLDARGLENRQRKKL